MAELTSAGYNLKTENEYFDEEIGLYQGIDPNWNLDPSTPDGLKAAHDAEVFSALDEAILAAYNSKDPNKARDLELDIIGALTGSVRPQGSPSTVTLTLTGTIGAVISADDALFESTVDGSQWELDADATIGGLGTVSAKATCTVNGTTEADAGTITQIVNTISGLQTVTNPLAATPGDNPETNAEFRVRRRNAVARPGNNQLENMLGEIFAVDNVRKAVILENDTNATDGDGLPAHSIAPIVDGGTDADVARAIYTKKNPGVLLYAAGTPVSETVTSPNYPNMSKEITFSRPVYVDMDVVVDVVDDGTLPLNIEDLIADAIVAYAGGDLVAASSGFNPLGFGIGENVPVSRIYTPVNQVVGQYGNSYVSSLTVDGETSFVAIDFNELARWTTANVTVNVT